MSRLPAELQEEVFRRFFEAAEIAHFDRDKREKAHKLKASGVSYDIIANATGLSQSQIEAL